MPDVTNAITKKQLGFLIIGTGLAADALLFTVGRLGAGAWSYLEGVRTENVTEPRAYVRAVLGAGSPVGYRERLDVEARLLERVMLGLRLLNMQADPVTGDLWVVDSAGTLHVLGHPPKLKEMEHRMDIVGTPDGAVEIADLVVTKNGAYLTDEARQRSISIDTQTVDVRQEFQAAGPLAVDTQGQRLFVVDGSVKIYGLGTGKPIGEIPIPTGDGSPVAAASCGVCSDCDSQVSAPFYGD